MYDFCFLKISKDRMVALQRVLIETPLGKMIAFGNEEAVYALQFKEDDLFSADEQITAPLQQLRGELALYFEGRLKNFSTPFKWVGTDFQKRVWAELLKIPFGSTCSYADLARNMGSCKAFRAVGNANGKNPLPILIPCHRVIRSNHLMGGYSGGLSKKRWLLEHERN